MSDQQGYRCDGDYANVWGVYEANGRRLYSKGELRDQESRSVTPAPAFVQSVAADVNGDGFSELFMPLRAASFDGISYQMMDNIDPRCGITCCG